MKLGDDQPGRGRGTATAAPGGTGGDSRWAGARRRRPRLAFLGIIAMLAFFAWVIYQLATAPKLTPEIVLLWVIIGFWTVVFIGLFVVAVAVTVSRARRRH